MVLSQLIPVILVAIITDFIIYVNVSMKTEFEYFVQEKSLFKKFYRIRSLRKIQF